MNNLLPSIHALDSCQSTNDEAFHFLKQSPACLVWTLDQSKGRGSRGREWRGPKDAMLALSLGLQQPLQSSNQAYPYALFAGLWVIETLQALIPEANLKLKWPNDILLDGKKLCGILCESRWQGQSCQVVLGVGINLHAHSDLADLPKGYASLEQALDRPEPSRICNLLAHRFPAAVQAYRQVSALKQAWLKHAWLPLHTRLTVHADGATHSGSFAGLGRAGEMLLQSNNGMITIQQVCDDFEVIDVANLN